MLALNELFYTLLEKEFRNKENYAKIVINGKQNYFRKYKSLLQNILFIFTL